MLTWLHFGDLHASHEDGWKSLSDLHSLVEDTNRYMAWGVDFAFLPGDNANHGEPEQYRRIRSVLDALEPRLLAIPGDHDFEPKSLDNFYTGLETPKLPLSMMVKGHRCLFLDIISPGSGGPDFKLGNQQIRWLEAELRQSANDLERPAVFMHAFPSDLSEGGDELAEMFARYSVASVDTGHTHYNELLNDGGTIYTATRSTGQIEEGPVGFSVHAIDGSAVSWRFKSLDQNWPFVLITSPADRRVVTDRTAGDQCPQTSFPVNAKVFGANIQRVEVMTDDQPARPMQRVKGSVGLWTADLVNISRGQRRLSVRAFDASGSQDTDCIEINVGLEGKATRTLKSHPGDHIHSVGAWEEKGFLGTQLGPNKNGTIKW